MSAAIIHCLRAWVCIFALCWIGTAAAQETPPAFTQAQIDQLVAPIALYPDTLLSQVLMAATYPADVAAAAKWVKAHPDQKGDQAVRAAENESWDPSVKALVAFPQVLHMMGEQPEWVQQLGDAFLASSRQVLDSAQRLRAQAQEAGNLKSTEQQKVVVEASPQAPATQVIKIEPADPQVVYVPTYNPTVVYGTWPYPAYPPYYYPPPPAYYPGYALASGLAFGVGVGITAALWSDCDWGGGDVDIDVNRYNEINRNAQIDRSKTKFEHNAQNRRGVPYRDAKSREQYGKSIGGATERASYRGHDPARDSQRQRAQASLQERGMDPAAQREQLRSDPQARERAQNAARSGGERARAGETSGLQQSARADFDRGGAADARQSSYARGSGDSALRDAGSGREARQQFDRGASSRQTMASRDGGSGFSGRSGGGGRAGGGGRGGRR